MKKTPDWLNKIEGETLLLLAAIVWGTGFVAQRLAMDSMQPFAFISLRFILGSLVLLPGLILKQRKDDQQPPKPNIGKKS
jgi:drug/metabolite transporter (DMT)-like permease